MPLGGQEQLTFPQEKALPTRNARKIEAND
jgi:hypothetical protein